MRSKRMIRVTFGGCFRRISLCYCFLRAHRTSRQESEYASNIVSWTYSITDTVERYRYCNRPLIDSMAINFRASSFFPSRFWKDDHRKDDEEGVPEINLDDTGVIQNLNAYVFKHTFTEKRFRNRPCLAFSNGWFLRRWLIKITMRVRKPLEMIISGNRDTSTTHSHASDFIRARG